MPNHTIYNFAPPCPWFYAVQASQNSPANGSEILTAGYGQKYFGQLRLEATH